MMSMILERACSILFDKNYMIKVKYPDFALEFVFVRLFFNMYDLFLVPSDN